MNTVEWYAQLVKPEWAPPAWVFGPVWTVLYIGIFLSFGAVFLMYVRRKIGGLVAAPFLLNFMANLAFTPLQFGLRSNLLASIDIILVLATLIWGMLAIYKHARWIALAQVPYLLWVAFATCLQLTITFMNA